MKEKIKKIIAKIFIVTGFFLPIILFIFASNYHPTAGLKYNIDHMSVVIHSGEPIVVKEKGPISWEGEQTYRDVIKYEGRIEIPFKYILTISIILIFVGVSNVAMATSDVANGWLPNVSSCFWKR